MQPRDIALTAAQVLADKKALDILVLDIASMTIIADYMVICSGRAATQVKALLEHVDGALGKAGLQPRRTEGAAEGRWAVLDYGSVIIHIFHEQERAYYQLERLWENEQNRVAFEGE